MYALPLRAEQASGAVFTAKFSKNLLVGLGSALSNLFLSDFSSKITSHLFTMEFAGPLYTDYFMGGTGTTTIFLQLVIALRHVQCES